MRILIAIASKNRVEVLKKNAFSWVPGVGVDFKIFVEPQEEEMYAREFGRENVMCLKENNQGLGYAKEWILLYAKNNNYDFVFKVDDDIKGWTDFRKSKVGNEASELCKKIIENSLKAFENTDVGVISFPYSFQMFESYSFKPVKRVQTAYIARIEYFHANRGLSVFEDFAVGLNALVKGKFVLSYGQSGIVMGVQVGKGTGGHQSFDRKKRVEVEMQVLRGIYPPLRFRKVQKEWLYEPDLRSVKIGKYI